MKTITLELDFHEAHFLLPAVSERRLEAAKAAAKAKDEAQREYQDVASQVLGRIETTLVDQMFPEVEGQEELAFR